MNLPKGCPLENYTTTENGMNFLDKITIELASVVCENCTLPTCPTLGGRFEAVDPLERLERMLMVDEIPDTSF